MQPSHLFGQGFSSFSHFAVGVVSFYSWKVGALFLIYQLTEYAVKTNHIGVDLTEFFLGYIAAGIVRSANSNVLDILLPRKMLEI